MSSPWSVCPNGFSVYAPIRSERADAMNQLPDRTVVIGLLATLGVVFALVFWFVRLAPPTERPMLWRQAPGERAPAALPGLNAPRQEAAEGSLI